MRTRSSKTKTREFYGKGFYIWLPGFTSTTRGESFDGYLAGDICPGGNFPMHEIYASPDSSKAIEMGRDCAEAWLSDHRFRARQGAKMVRVDVDER